MIIGAWLSAPKDESSCTNALFLVRMLVSTLSLIGLLTVSNCFMLLNVTEDRGFVFYLIAITLSVIELLFLLLLAGLVWLLSFKLKTQDHQPIP